MLLPLNSEQQAAADAIEGNHRVVAGPGSGKCLGKGTPILMYDGTVRAVENIIVGDLLIGPDSKPRKVLGLAHGQEEMFLISPVKGSTFVCNRSHILALQMSGKRYEGKENVEVSVHEYLKKNSRFKNRAKLWRSSVSWVEKRVELDPYFVGLWLGDGASSLSGVTVSKPDIEIESYLRAFSSLYGLDLRKISSGDKSPTWQITSGNGKGKKHGRNLVLNMLRDLFGPTISCATKFIPNSYLINSRSVRLGILAGLLDSDGSLDRGGFDFISKSKVLAEQVVFLCRSLGFAAYLTPCEKGIKKTNFIGQYFRVSISGELSDIPTKISRKQASKRKQIKSVLRTGFSASSVGLGEYFGFEIDGDGLFLLGDFTVTHNTHTLIQRYLGMLMKGVSANDILNLTFTSAAADEMVSRVGLLGAESVFRTFHSWAIDFLKRERAHLPFRVEDTIIPVYGQDFQLLKDLLKTYPAITSFRALKEKISEWKRSGVDPDEAIEQEYHNGPAFFLAAAYKDYEQKCRAQGWLDFDDCIVEAVKLLENNPEVRARNQKKYIAIDEFQDTDSRQLRLLELLHGGNLFAVGDPNQSVFEWRGAHPDVFEDLKNKFSANTLFMGHNFRSTQRLVAFFKKILPVDNGIASHMVSEREEGVDPTFTKFGDELQEASVVLSRITDPDNTAVIARTNRQLLHFQRVCMARNQKSQILGRKNLWQQSEVAHLLKLAKEKDHGTRPAHEVLTELIREHNLTYLYRNAGNANEKDPTENLNDLVKLSARRGTTSEFLDWLRRLTYASKSRKKAEPVLTLSTVHSAKGREFKHVFLIGVNQKLMPHQDGELLEEKRIFFVGASRAADFLHISFSGPRSQFLNEFEKDIQIWQPKLEASQEPLPMISTSAISPSSSVGL